MNIRKNSLLLLLDFARPWVVLAILLIFTYAKFLGHPYGFRYDPATAGVFLVFDDQGPDGLQVGDRLIEIGPVSWDEFQSDLTVTFFDGVKTGDVVPIIVERNGQVIHVDWVYPGINQPEFLEQIVSEWIFAYIFWLAGTMTLLFLRPKDVRRFLLSAFYFLTSIWLIAGSGVSAYHILYSALVLRVVIWLCIPIYLHLHLVFPQPLVKIPARVLWVVYGATLITAVAQGFQLLPDSLYIFGFLAAISGSMVLLIVHYRRQPAIRHELRLLFVTAFLAFAFPLVFWLAFISVEIPAWLGGASLLSFPLLPLSYLYAAYRRQLGGLELRVNRFISVYLFLILLGMIGLPLVVAADYLLTLPHEALIVSLVFVVIAIVLSIFGYPAFQTYVETRILGIPLPSKQLLERYSTHITTSTSILDLTRILHEEVLPSLMISQFAFLHLAYGKLKLLSLINVEEVQTPKEQDVPELQARFGDYLSPELGMSRPLDWIRLILPLKFGDRLIGIWLFGRRDPDDIYAQAEIPILKSLANQTAIALSNILQTRQIQEMYETNVLRHEQERLRMARDLHDSVLNELAALVIRGDAPVLSPNFQQAYEEVTERLREIVSDLRPPMLNFGLKLALEGIADNLMERNQNSVQVTASIKTDGELRYPETVEIHLFRIVQEACQNALRYAHAKTIQITGTVSAGKIDITVEDDGIGFVSEVSLKLDEMLANRHFGMAGMLERANLIGAEIKIDSKPQTGARVNVKWEGKNSI